MSKVAVILPSRGLIFSRTADEILQNVKGVPHKFFFSHKRPIPECFEEPTKRALEDKEVTHLWFVEDDMILPPDTLQKLLKKDKAVVTADYPVNKYGRGSIFKVKKEIIFCGTGCLLVKREVFDELTTPYWRTDMKWNAKNCGDFIKMTRSQTTDLDGYGLHDVNFCMNLYRLGIPIHAITRTLGQRKLLALGKAGTNDGAHQIETWETVVKDHLLNTIKQWPVQPRGNLITVMTDTGEVTLSVTHAKKLIKLGKARKLPKRGIVVDWNEQ